MGYRKRIPSSLLIIPSLREHPKLKILLESTGSTQEQGLILVKCLAAAAVNLHGLLRHSMNELFSQHKREVHKFLPMIFQVATIGGNLYALRWLARRCFHIDSGAAQAAAVMGDMAIMCWLDESIALEHILDGINDWVGGAVELEHIELLDWAHANGHLRREGFMTRHLRNMGPTTFDWYVRKFGRPNPDTMNRIRSKAASQMYGRIMPHINDPQHPYLETELLSTVLTSRIFFLNRQELRHNVGVLKDISIRWEGCIHETIANSVGGSLSRYATEALIHLLVHLGKPLSCDKHVACTTNIHEAIRQILGPIILVSRSSGTRTPPTVTSDNIEGEEDVAEEEVPDLVPHSSTMTVEELIVLINGDMNATFERQHNPFGGIMIDAPSTDELDDQPEGDAAQVTGPCGHSFKRVPLRRFKAPDNDGNGF